MCCRKHFFQLKSLAKLQCVLYMWSKDLLCLFMNAVAVCADFTLCADSWQEQRRYTYVAIEALNGHPVTADIKDELDRISPQWPDLDGE